MTKDETQQLKGFAILLMLWIHLFSDTDLEPLTHCLLPFFGGKPLAFAFSRIAAACVPIYIFLGGYGLTCVYRQRQGSMHNARRALSLMANFWMVFLLFVPLACITNPLLYPGSLLTLLLNVAAIDYSYNGAWWFLLPYVVLTLAAAPLIRLVLTGSRRRDMLLTALLLVAHVAGYLLKDIPIADGSPLRIVYTAANVLYMLLPFVAGILFVKYDVLPLLRQRLSRLAQWQLLSLLALLGMVKMLLGGSALLNLPFVLLLLPILLSIRMPARLTAVLAYFGSHSTNLWLTHYFFAFYLFGPVIYRLSYPLLIFAALVGVSLFASYVVRWLYAPLRRRIRRGDSRAQSCRPTYS
ncbi:MAG: acyltransferase family protein [Selenomonas sp.]|nr:acyltransferase family protein [Selenomonas sp.]